MLYLLSNRDALIAEQKAFVEFMDKVPQPDRNKAKLEMGSWLADYFDDAGYVNWEVRAPIYKAMIMAAFPPIDDLDDVKPDFATMDIDLFQENATKVLRVMDSHLNLEQRRVKGLQSSAMSTLVRRR